MVRHNVPFVAIVMLQLLNEDYWKRNYQDLDLFEWKSIYNIGLN